MYWHSNYRRLNYFITLFEFISVKIFAIPGTCSLVSRFCRLRAASEQWFEISSRLPVVIPRYQLQKVMGIVGFCYEEVEGQTVKRHRRHYYFNIANKIAENVYRQLYQKLGAPPKRTEDRRISWFFAERWNTPNKIDKHTAAKTAFTATSYNRIN